MRYQFGPYILDEDNMLLLYEQGDCVGQIDLRKQSFRVLAYLLKNPGKLLSPATILYDVWRDDNGGHIAVTDNTLEQSIGDIRRALFDTGHEHRYVQTVRGKGGYRFASRVEELEPAPPPLPLPRVRPDFKEYLKRLQELPVADRLVLYLVYVKGEQNFALLGLLTGESDKALRNRLAQLWKRITNE